MEHRRAIAQSFGPHAEAYLASPIHSQGGDLQLLAEAVAEIEKPIVLDLGCGAGHASFAVAPVAKEVIAYDLTDSMLKIVAATAAVRGLTNVSTEQGAVEQLPFAAGRFDWVVSRYSAHHWRDVPQALREIRRVLKPGGQICFIDVAGGPEPLLDTYLQALELLRDPSHVRDYTEVEWLSMFESASLQARITERWRIQIEFAAWVKRIGTSTARIAALESLWSDAPTEVRTYFNLQKGLAFESDVIMIRAAANYL